MHGCSTDAWTHHVGERAALPDVRLKRRTRRVLEAMVNKADASIAQRHEGWAELHGAYRLLDNDRVDAVGLQAGAYALTLADAARDDASVVLGLHDMTELKPVHALSATKLQQHTVLAAGEARHALFGVLHQRWFDEPRVKPGETRKQRRNRFTRSRVWPEAVHATRALRDAALHEHDAALHESPCQTGVNATGKRLIHVADREADDFQMFTACLEAGDGFVVRSQHDRKLEAGGTLSARLASTTASCGVRVSVTRRGQVGPQGPPGRWRDAQAARVACCDVRFTRVTLAAPTNDPRDWDALPVHVVEVREVDAPQGVKPLHWRLLCSEAVTCAADALRVVAWYRRRWLIEEFHKAQKSGCRLEATQLAKREAFVRYAALCALVAVRLLQTREWAEDEPDALAWERVDATWVAVVAKLAKVEAGKLTMRQFLHAIARRGGWLGRKHDPRPGWQALQAGFRDIAAMVQGVHLLRE